MTTDAPEVPMANTASESGAAVKDPEFVAPPELHFDFDNPRFVEHEAQNEEELIQYLYDHVDVDELIQSILSAGYVDFEPLSFT
jgi:hypothetical protein